VVKGSLVGDADGVGKTFMVQPATVSEAIIKSTTIAATRFTH